MRRILIVDDELFILNGLSGIIKEADYADLEVCKASSADEAIEWLHRATIDIVLTDICMPGMDGIELQRHIIRQWPRCKVIFLTGHDEFTYIKEAIHHRAVDYILKTEGDEAVLGAIRRALSELDSEMEREAQVEQAQSRLQIALPSLQNEFLTELLQGELPKGRPMQEQFDALNLQLTDSRPVLLLLARVDEWLAYGTADKALLLFAVQNIADEYLNDAVATQSFVYEKTRIACLIQPMGELQGEEEFPRLIRFVHGTAERIQQTCNELLKLKVSFAASSAFCTWSLVSGQHDALRRAMRRSFGAGYELLLTEQSAEELIDNAPVEWQMKRVCKLTDELGLLLESGQREVFRHKLAELMNVELLIGDADLRLAAACRLLSMFMTFLANEGLLKPLLGSANMDSLLKLETHISWEQTMLLFAELGETVFMRKESISKQYGKSLVHRLRQYIDANLSGDLSVIRLGEVVSLNASYLSRLYKQLTGESLSDTIMSTRLSAANRKLRETDDKVQDIAAQVGFESAAYFNRFFKKASGLTPQEYREQARI
ncbi:response regulator [Cohnella silvisoli]|uniref:Response regulator n=1 Tax=Cohnella silvisoli TaxID=2873699 RepID=A0ABV1KLK9_9BACL|nr:response regulator [Cohnella silvisoli]MCD9020660.1 response regulator [Cohnella silvisoli]